MLDTRIVKLLRQYAKKKKVKSLEVSILEEKYNITFAETKYLFEKLFSLGEDNYSSEVANLLKEIEQKENILIAILTELIKAK